MPRDPYRNFRFEVEIVDGSFDHIGFKSVSGLNHEVAVIDYREGGENEVMRKLPGQSSYNPVVFTRGISSNEDFVRWIRKIFDLDRVDGAQGEVEGWRKNVTVYARDKSGERIKQWIIWRAWPSNSEIADLDSAGNDVLIETLTLQNEGVEQIKLT